MIPSQANPDVLTKRADSSHILEIFALAAGLSAIIALILFKSGETAVPVLLAIPLAVITISFLIKKPAGFVLGYFLVLPAYLENPEGVSVAEIIFLLYTLAVAFFYFFLPLITGRLKTENTLDKLFIIFTLMLPYASFLGLFNGAAAYSAFGELTYYTGVFTYFAFRYHLPNPSFQKSLLALIILLLVFVMARNAWYYQEIILQAYMPWQVSKARVAANEVLILFSSVLFSVALVYVKQLKYKMFAIVLLGVSIASLVLTQSRGYWLAYVISFIVIFILLNREKKIQMVVWFGTIAALVITTAALFFSSYFDLVTTALVERFQSIATSTQKDVSLLERFDESASVFNKIIVNPVIGYGLGVEYTKFYYFDRIHGATSYVHNGYLAVWYKFGLPGLFILLSICLITIRNAYRIFKNNPQTVHKILGLSIIAVIFGMFLVNNTSPQFLAFDSTLLLTIMAAYTATVSSKPEVRIE